MGYEVKPDGTIVVETLEEALAVQRSIFNKKNKIEDVRLTSHRSHKTTLRRNVGERGFRLIRAIAKVGNKIATKDLVSSLKLNTGKALSFYVRDARTLIKTKSGSKSPESFLWRERGSAGTHWCINEDLLREIGILN